MSLNAVITSLIIFSVIETSGQQTKVIRPIHELKENIRTVVKDKPTKAPNPDWSIYSDVEMETTIDKIKVGDSVVVSGWAPSLYFIMSNTIRGYISSNALLVNRELDSLAKVVKEQSSIHETEKIKNIKEQEKVKYQQMLVKKFGNSIAQRLLKAEFWIGMTSEMLRYSQGRPDTINTTVMRNLIHEQWVYDGVYFYFQDDILVSYQL